MNFNKKLKIRLITAIVYVVLGVSLMVTFNLTELENEVLSYLSFAFVIIGLARIRNHFIITRNEETVRKREIAEKDERNVSIVHKARSITFIAYLICAGMTVNVLMLCNMMQTAQIISYTVAFIVLVYWISYFIISKRN